jgi:hypothetical protein
VKRSAGAKVFFLFCDEKNSVAANGDWLNQTVILGIMLRKKNSPEAGASGRMRVC